MTFFKIAVAYIKDFYDLMVGSFKAFFEDRIFKLSASLAYYTVFSIVPLIVIIIAATSIVLEKEAVEGTLYGNISRFVGPTTALQIQQFVSHATLTGQSNIALTIGVISLLIGATAVFTEIQDSINFIWEVKAKPKKGWVKIIVDRLLSFSLIISIGFLLLVSLMLNSVITFLAGKMQAFFGYNTSLFVVLLNDVIVFAIITFLFAIIYKILPDVKLKWKPALAGALFTTVLFVVGKYLIEYYIERVKPDLIFGTAGSIVIILVWVYYTAVILYFGAEFTQVFAEKYSDGIQPSKYAVHTKIIELNRETETLPAQHPEQTKESAIDKL